MSHEIRTPMNAIIGMGNMALLAAETPRMRQYLKIIQDAGHSLLNLINDILDFSKIEAGRLDLEFINFDLRESLDGLADLFSRQIAKKKIELIIAVDKEVPCALVGDPLRLRQILVNLTNNALKFTEKGEIAISVRLAGISEEKATLHFAVRDTGSGINHEQIKKIFAEYCQGDESISRLYGGTGLGLAISRQLVTLMGGEISATSEPGQGSTFSFTVQLQLQPQELQQPLRLEDQSRDSLALVAASHPGLRENLIEQLSGFGCRTTSLDSLEKVRERLAADQSEPPSLLLLDLALAGPELPAFLRGLAQNPQTAALPALLLAPLDGEPAREALALHPPTSVLTKPVKPSFLFAAVEKALAPEAAAPADFARDENLPAADLPSPLRGKRILLVEDEPVNRMVTTQHLTNLGIMVDIAGNGQEAVERLRHAAYDAVVMDIMMPVLNGHAASRTIRQELKLSLPIIALTANALAGDREKCLEAGMDDYLTKPVDFEKFSRTLERWLLRKRETW